MADQADIDVVLANNAAFCRRDLDGMLVYYAPDAHVVDRRPGGFGEYTGKDAIHAYYGGIFDNTVAIQEEIEIVSAAGGMVVASCRVVAELASDMGSGDFVVEYALLVDVRDGLIVQLEVHPDADAALASRR